MVSNDAGSLFIGHRVMICITFPDIVFHFKNIWIFCTQAATVYFKEVCVKVTGYVDVHSSFDSWCSGFRE